MIMLSLHFESHVLKRAASLYLERPDVEWITSVILDQYDVKPAQLLRLFEDWQGQCAA